MTSLSVRDPKHLLPRIAVCFLVSGCIGLVYEIVWIRMLGLVFGHTVFAITTVLAAFMGGLALGSFSVGRLVDRHPRPLRLYGLLEIGVGLFCLGVPFALPWLERVYLALSAALGLSLIPFTLAQFLVLFGVLVVPTTLMGATLPVLSRFFVREEDSLGRRVGFLYALNTLGAVAGTALAGYVLLPAFGMRGTLYLAVTVNMGIGLLCLVYDRALGPAVREEGEAPTVAPRERVEGFLPLACALAVSGAASMIYEIAWTRALTLVLGSSTYAFTAMLMSFLIGIAGGSALFSRYVERRGSVATFVMLQAGIALSAAAILPVFEQLPGVLLRAMAVSVAPGFLLVVQVVLSISAMLVPTLFIGATFPCAVKALTRGVQKVGDDVGRLYAVNTLGAIGGTVLAGFALIPSLGVQRTAKAAVLVNLAIAVVLLFVAVPGARVRRTTVSAIAVAIAAGVIVMPTWNPAVMASGVAIYGHTFRPGASTADLARHPLLFYEDGLTATVTVHAAQGKTFLRVNGKTDASTGLDMHTQLMSGHLPMLLHGGAPKNVLVIGLGSGVTVSAITRYPNVERVDVVEIEPAIVRASRYFKEANRDALADPRVHVAVADGRNYLLAGRRRYDVVISEPSNPWIGGLAALFSEEFYALAKRRLAPDGVMLQWVQGYGFAPSDLKMVVNTFRTAFPATTIWHTHGMGDYLLIGRARAQAVDLTRLVRTVDSVPGLRDDLVRSGLSGAESIFADFLLNELDATRFSADGGVNNDDVLPLEFSAPRSLHFDTAALNFRVLMSYRSVDLPLVQPSRAPLETAAAQHAIGVAHLAKGLPAEAARHFRAALRADADHVPSLVGLGRAEARQNLSVAAVTHLQAALRRDPNAADAHAVLAHIYGRQGLPELALEAARKANALAPTTTHRIDLAQRLLEQGRLEEAEREFKEARRTAPGDAAAVIGLSDVYIRLRRVSDAATVLGEGAAAHPENPQIAHLLAKTYLASRQYPQAVATLQRVARVADHIAAVHVDLGHAYAGVGDTRSAIAAFERGLALDPTQVAAAQTVNGLYRTLDGGR